MIGADNVTYVTPITCSRIMTYTRRALLWENVKHGPKLRELRRRVLAHTIYSNPPSYITWPFWSRRRKIYYLSGYRAGAKKIASKSSRLRMKRACVYVRTAHPQCRARRYASWKGREKEGESEHRLLEIWDNFPLFLRNSNGSGHVNDVSRS